MQDPEVIRYLEARHKPQGREAVEAYVRECAARGDFLWGMYSSPSLHVGNIRLSVNWIHRFGELGLVIPKTNWGKGYGTEAIQLASAFAFNTLGLHKLVAGILEGNIGSFLAFGKAGFAEEARLRSQYWVKDRYVDDVVVSRFAPGA